MVSYKIMLLCSLNEDESLTLANLEWITKILKENVTNLKDFLTEIV